MYRLLSLLLVFVLAACAPAASPDVDEEPLVRESTRTPGGPTLTPISFIPPDATPAQGRELLRMEGQGAGEQTLTLAAETTLRLHWQNFDEGLFQVFVMNSDTQAPPEYQQISMALAAAPSIGYTEYTFIPGEYQVKVQTESGEWVVWVEEVTP
jgi:hypothetical protein